MNTSTHSAGPSPIPIFQAQMLLLVLMSNLYAGCRPTAQTKSSATPQGFIQNPSNLWENGTIKVCWDRSSGLSYPKTEERIKANVRFQMAFAGIDFTGWHDCDEGSTGAKRIIWSADLSPVAGKAGGIGLNSRSLKSPLTLLTSKLMPDWCPDSKSYLESNCLLNVALHEFGHVVGLLHEMDRHDVTGESFCSRQLSQGVTNALQVGDPDRHSVMNYCRVFSANVEGKLLVMSSRDIATIKALYRGPLAFIDLPFVGDQGYLNDYTISIKNLPITVRGKDLTHYQYAWVGAQDPCQKPGMHWSDWRSVDMGIGNDELPKPVSRWLYKQIKLCVIGKTSAKEQSDMTASSLVFSIDQGESAVMRPF